MPTMNKKYLSQILLFLFCLNFVHCELSYSPHPDAVVGTNHQNVIPVERDTDAEFLDNVVDVTNYDKRMEGYDIGLRPRAYTYTNTGTSGVKRLPNYNFGLGKRARPYSFGLGKRANNLDLQYDDDFEQHQNSNDLAYIDDKRNRPYSFGMGKRNMDASDDTEKRQSRYGFGLGKRNSLDRDRYGFGLGKRSAAGGGRYGFGLGRR